MAGPCDPGASESESAAAAASESAALATQPGTASLSLPLGYRHNPTICNSALGVVTDHRSRSGDFAGPGVTVSTASLICSRNLAVPGQFVLRYMASTSIRNSTIRVSVALYQGRQYGLLRYHSIRILVTNVGRSELPRCKTTSMDGISAYERARSKGACRRKREHRPPI
eukprot:1066021-Rhodomonas_salina.1